MIYDPYLITLIWQKAVRIIFLILGAIIVNKLIAAFLRKIRFFTSKVGERINPGQQERLKTIRLLIKNTSKFIINFIVLMMILSELGINITPLLTGAGILGLGIGFGARTLVSDLIAGFFIILENQFNLGDTIQIDKSKGKVIKISLRTITLKDKDKNIHIIPNSNIKTVIKSPKKP